LNAVLDKVMDIEVLKYNYIDNPEGAMKVMGVSANATQKIFPEIVSSEKGEVLVGIDYSKFGVISIKAIQEQQVIIEDQQQQINDLQQQIDELRQLIITK
jgi:TolA-binding protein